MVRANFGGGTGDFVYSAAASGYVRLVAGDLTVWDSETGGTRLTDLLLGGVAATHIPIGDLGQIPTFQGPSGVLSLWVDGGGPSRSKLTTTDIVTSSAGATDAGVAALVTGGGATQDALTASLGPGGTAGNIDKPTAQGVALVQALIFGG